MQVVLGGFTVRVVLSKRSCPHGAEQRCELVREGALGAPLAQGVGADAPVYAVVPLAGRAVGVGLLPLAAQIVQAKSGLAHGGRPVSVSRLGHRLWTVLPNSAVGLPEESRVGILPARSWAMVQTIQSGWGGQPGC